MSASGALAAASTRCDSSVNIGHFLEKAGQKWLAVFFHFLGGVAAYRMLISLHSIDQARAKPI